MDNVDNEVLTRVWQRVHPSSETPLLTPSQLSDFLYCEGRLATTYLQLLRRHKGPSGKLYQRLYQQKRSNIATLRGICALMGCQCTSPDRIKPYEGHPDSVLRRCYRDTLQYADLYHVHCTHPEFGSVFLHLVQQSRHHCQILVQLMGSAPRKRSL